MPPASRYMIGLEASFAWEDPENIDWLGVGAWARKNKSTDSHPDKASVQKWVILMSAGNLT